MLTAQILGSMSFVNIAILIVLVIAVCAIVLIYAKNSGVAPPPWFGQVVWTVIGAVVVIVAIIFVANVAGWR